MSDKLLTPGQLAALLGVKPRTVRSWRERKTGPTYVILSDRLIRYRESVVQRWIDAHDTAPVVGEVIQMRRAK